MGTPCLKPKEVTRTSIRPSDVPARPNICRKTPFSLAVDRLVVFTILSARARRGASIFRSRAMAPSRLSASSARGWARRVSL